MTKHLGNANTAELTYSEAATVVGEPAIKTGVQQFDQVNDASFGVWQAEPGTFVGVLPADEVFVVLTGAAAITTGGGSPLAVGPGDVVHLAVGEEARWDISETLRILYVFP
ncbi:cupin domain-containing protein [Mycolicibacterium baixiangningiae]|uniref:cupin domain-containing protein n=1 Tax=Mycolicibacterium baixiangningiae TaxID=2761578 RepID=UPI0018D0142A|nr:cupin domain-containing protein [Mycolicibacterium baixiangningiae]